MGKVRTTRYDGVSHEAEGGTARTRPNQDNPIQSNPTGVAMLSNVLSRFRIE